MLCLGRMSTFCSTGQEGEGREGHTGWKRRPSPRRCAHRRLPKAAAVGGPVRGANRAAESRDLPRRPRHRLREALGLPLGARRNTSRVLRRPPRPSTRLPPLQDSVTQWLAFILPPPPVPLSRAPRPGTDSAGKCGPYTDLQEMHSCCFLPGQTHSESQGGRICGEGQSRQSEEGYRAAQFSARCRGCL